MNRKRSKQLSTRLILIHLWALFLFSQVHADESWKRPLVEKADIIEAGIQKRHNILGLYPSMVEIPFDSDTIDITTRNPMADIQHAVCWTANYLAGLSYRCAYLKKTHAEPKQIEIAKKRADEVFEGVYRCQLVTGVRGLQARGYFVGHGESYAERQRSTKLPYWRQGEVDGKPFRWVGDPSHHNYSDVIHGLGQYYTLAAEDEQKERATEAIDALVSYWVDNDLKIAKHDRSLPEVPILGFTDGKTLNTRVMMAIAGAKVAHYATGKKKFKKVYDRLIDEYGVRNLEVFKTGKDFDDAEHVFCHLDLLFRIETDPELLKAYRKVADGLWTNHKNDAQSLFTYIYYAIAPDAPEKEKALKEALFTLQTFPTDMTIKPRMNSLNPDLKPPYPTYLAAWDNEYIWKANVLRPDGWTSRIVVDVAVSPEDKMVIYAVGQEGGLYQSRDGASTWRNWRAINQNLRSPVRRVVVGERSRILMTVCDDGFYLTTTAGSSWQKIPVPLDNEKAVDIEISPEDFNIIYAITDKHVYRSRDYGDEYLGQSWEKLTTELPTFSSPKYVIAHGSPGRLYVVSENRIFTRRLNEHEWTRGSDFGLGGYAETYPWLVADPANPNRVWVGFKAKYGALGPLSILQESQDAGKTWSNSMADIWRIVSEKGFPALMQLGVRSELNHFVADTKESEKFYGTANRGVVIERKTGRKKSVSGFNVPLVRSLFVSRYSDWIFAGTPGGLYISKNGGETWQDGHLWLQFNKNTRRELGGASFIDAYWRARYYGFIDDETANEAFEHQGDK
jgi:photosystem II stability/assembly factor-like uncharacterized protein